MTSSLDRLTASRRRAVAVGLMLAMALMSALSMTPRPSAAAPNALSIAITTPLNTVDPDKINNNLQASTVLGHVFEGLTEVTPSGQIKPLLATDWTLSADGLTYTFHLRKGVTFSDGTPFNADAVVVNYKRLFDPNAVVPLRSSAGPVKDVRVVDPYTVQLIVSRPFSGLPGALGGEWWSFVSPKSIQEWGERLGTEMPSGTGPYKIAAFSAPNSLTLAKNGSYWGTPGRLETIRFTSVTDPNARLASLLSGGADVDIYVTPDQVNRLKSSRNHTLLTVPSARMYMVTLPMQMPEMQDIRVRQALNYAVDRNQLIKTVFGGLAKADDSSIPLGIGYQPIGVLPYDPQKAAALLREAGWTKGSNGILQRNGQPFPAIHFEASNGHYPNDTALAPAVAGYLTAAGFPVKLYLDPFSTFFPTSAKVAAKEHWFVQMGWAAPGYDDAAFLYVIYGSQDIGGGNNWQGYSNPQIDALNVQIEKTVNPDSRNALIARTARVVYQDLPAIYLMSAEWLVGARQGLSGAVVSPSEFHSFIHADWNK